MYRLRNPSLTGAPLRSASTANSESMAFAASVTACLSEASVQIWASWPWAPSTQVTVYLVISFVFQRAQVLQDLGRRVPRLIGSEAALRFGNIFLGPDRGDGPEHVTLSVTHLDGPNR